MSFHKDLEAGKAKELEAIPLIIEHYKAHHQNVEAWLNPHKDLARMREGDVLDSYGIKWEIKYDRKASETGNVYLEHPALKRSGADYVLFFIDNPEYASTQPFMVSKDILMVLVDDNAALEEGFRKYKIVNVGLNNEGTLLPLDELVKISRPMRKRPAKLPRQRKKSFYATDRTGII